MSSQPSGRGGRKLTRAALLAGAVAAGAVGVDLVRGELRGAGETRYGVDFASAAERRGWPEPWLPQHYDRDLAVREGHAVYSIPAGLDTSAPHQPMPVFLLDHGCANATHQMAFSTDNTTLRPGLLFSGTTDVDYLAVTVESGHLILSRYGREDRTQLARAGCPRLKAGVLHNLEVEVQGSSVRARVWPATEPPPAWRLTAHAADVSTGTPGVLLVHPTDFQPATL